MNEHNYGYMNIKQKSCEIAYTGVGNTGPLQAQ